MNRVLYGLKHSIKLRIYPNKSQIKWLEENIYNTRKFHNYLLEQMYEEVQDDDDDEKFHEQIQWDNLSHFSLYQKYFKDKRPTTTASIYDQVRIDVFKNFSSFYKLNRGKPRFKSFSGKQSFRLPQNGCDIIVTRKDNVHRPVSGTFDDYKSHIKHKSSLKYNLGWIKIPNIKDFPYIKCYVRFTLSSKEISSVTFSRYPDGKYYVTLVLRREQPYLSEDPAMDEYDIEETEVGIDINVSNKTRIAGHSSSFIEEPEFIKEAPTPYKDYFSKLQKEQRKLSRKVKFSKNWNKQRIKLAKIHKKIADIRLNYNRQTAAWLTTHFQRIVIEDLHISDMKRGQPKWFQKLYNDACIYQLIQCIKWSCNKKYRELWYVSPEHTSKTCNNCMFTNHDLKVGTSRWVCPNCGKTLQRDLNAAANILALYNCEVSGELLQNSVYYEPFNERVPEENNFILEHFSKQLGEEVTTI